MQRFPQVLSVVCKHVRARPPSMSRSYHTMNLSWNVCFYVLARHSQQETGCIRHADEVDWVWLRFGNVGLSGVSVSVCVCGILLPALIFPDELKSELSVEQTNSAAAQVALQVLYTSVLLYHPGAKLGNLWTCSRIFGVVLFHPIWMDGSFFVLSCR